jgi:hypothetical protein
MEASVAKYLKINVLGKDYYYFLNHSKLKNLTYPNSNGCISNFRRLVGTPTGAARRGRCPHRPQAARQCENLKCTHSNI